MKKLRVTLLAVVAVSVVLLCSCNVAQGSDTGATLDAGHSPVSSTAGRPSGTAFKGMELYSWQAEDGEWVFSVLTGTNRNKSLEEVQATALDLKGVEESFGHMAVGESVFWTSYVIDASGRMIKLPRPPADMVRELMDAAARAGVKLGG